MDKVSISINLPAIEITKIEEDSRGDLLIYVETTEEFTHCNLCGKKLIRRHGYGKERKIRHLSAFGQDTYIIYKPHRYICDDCDNHPTTTATPTWHKATSAYTIDYENHILLSLVNSTIADVCRKERLTEAAVKGILDRSINSKIDWTHIFYLGVIGIDEIALKKGYNDYITLITCKADGKIKLLAVLKGRKKTTVKTFLKTIPKRLYKTVEAICTDMNEGYINAVKEIFKKKTIVVVDRYHVAKLYRGAVDKYRQKILRLLKKELPEAEYKKLKGAMHILRRHNECLTQDEKEILNNLFAHSAELTEAYRLALKLTQIFNAHMTREEALVKLDEWIREVRNSKMHCFDKFIKALRKWKYEIANYFVNRNTSGFVEGLNNKAKVLKRRCYGIFNLKHFFQRLHLDISGYDLLLGNSAC